MVQEPCGVCGKPKSSEYYGGISCNSCRAFFYRQATNTSIALCEHNNDCVVNYQVKKCCPGCRIRKCLEIGMKIRLVGRRIVEPKAIPKFTQSEKNVFISRFCGQLLNQGLKAMMQTKDINELWPLLHYWKGYDRHILMRNGLSPSLAGGNPNACLLDILSSPRSYISQNTAAIMTICDYSTIGDHPYNFRSQFCRVMVLNAEWLAVFSVVHQMSYEDRILLMRHHEQIIYLIHHERIRKGHAVVISDCITYFSKYLPPWLQDNWHHYLITRASAARHIFEIIKHYQVTEEEMLLVRLIAMFAPQPAMSDEGRALAIQTRIRLSQILAEYMKQSNTADIHERLTAVLSIERYVKEIASRLLPMMVALVVYNCEGMDCPLGRDVYLNNC